MATKPKLDADLSGKPVDQTDYHSKIRSLMYLTSSRPDIVQAVCYCARYQVRPTEKHLKEVKRIFRYLRGTINMGLWYPKGSGFELTAFSDADYAGCIDTRKSTSGGIQFLGDKLVSWMSKKQNCTAMSSAELNYVARLFASWLITDTNCADMFTNASFQDRFQYLVRRIVMRCLISSKNWRSYALSWKPCQGDSLNLPDHRIHKDGDGDALFQLKSDSLPHAHAQTTKTYYKHQDSRIMKAQELKTKTSAQTLIYKIFLQRYQVYQGRLLASFQDDAKYEHVGQDTRSQGFTPDGGQTNVDEVKSARDSHPKKDLIGTNIDVASVTSGIKGFTNLKSRGSLLDVIDELIKVGHAMLYNMDGCLGHKAKKGWIQELNTKHRVSFVALQETKMEKIDLFSIKALWGNFSFDYVFSPFVGYSRGILCVWDPTLFLKDNLRSLIQLTEKRILWDYLRHMIDTWDGECVLLGDFNEVRSIHERYGTVFNPLGANSFNNFITMAGLVDLPLEGYSYTWSHKSASKMIKLHRFLISE
ncbi:retrovirus-related pol polyprotein from transposon TNT 1-94 [Tanacetum coccineum]